MRNLHKISAVISLLISCTFTGCFPSGESKLSSTSEVSISNAENPYDLPEIDGLGIEVKLPENYPSELPAVYVQPRIFDDELIRTVFIKDSDVITKQSIEENRCFFKTEEGGLYGCNEGGVLIRKGGDIPSSQSTFHSLWGNFCFDKIYSDKELSFSKTDAKKRADEVIASLGIENVGVPKIYSVSADEANAIYDILFLDGNERKHPIWSENDGIYIFEYPIIFENVPVAVKGLYVLEDVFHFQSVISVVVTENDIVYFNADEIYETDYKKGDIIPISISPSKALEILTDYYSKVVIQVPFTIYDCELVYITAERSPEIKLTPAWQFSKYYADDTDSYLRQDYILLDANSGRIIYG